MRAGAGADRPPVRRVSAVWPLYRLAGTLLAPLARPHLGRRARRGKEDRERLDEKRGVPSVPRFEEAPVWLHAVSVGESVAALALAHRLREHGPLLFTTATPTAARRVAAEAARFTSSGAPLVHQYAPLDAPPFLSRFLAHWRPRLALVAEGEVWPATLHALAKAGVPRIHVSARLSDRTFARWLRRPAMARPVFGALDLVLAQSEEQAERFARLGAPRTFATGNLKFDAPPPAADEAAAGALRETLGGRPAWLAASTHEGEEAIVCDVHRRLAARRSGLVTLVAPRHPERGAQVAALAQGVGIAVARRSKREAPVPGIYVVDTLGELGTMFSLVGITFLGASLVAGGGHNAAEPAAHGNALLTGPCHGALFEPFLQAGAASVVHDAGELAAAVAHLMTHEAQREAQARSAAEVLARERGALARTLDHLAPFLRSTAGTGP